MIGCLRAEVHGDCSTMYGTAWHEMSNDQRHELAQVERRYPVPAMNVLQQATETHWIETQFPQLPMIVCAICADDDKLRSAYAEAIDGRFTLFS